MSGYYFSGWLYPSGDPINEGQTVCYNDNIVFIDSEKLAAEFPDLFEYRDSWSYQEKNIEKTSILNTFLIRPGASNILCFVSTEKENVLKAIKAYKIDLL